MRKLRRLGWSAAIAIAAASPAIAQTNGTIGTASTQASSLGSLGTTTTSTGGNTLPGSTNGVPGASSSVQGSFTSISAPSKTQNGSSNSGVNTSNVFRNYFGAVYYQGSSQANIPNGNPGGFGAPLYPSNSATARGGAGGGRGGTNTQDAGGILAPLPRQIAYAAQVQFKMPGGNAMPQLQTDLRSVIDRIPNTMLENPAAVQVDVNGRNVTLRGTVRDEDEFHVVEGLMRLTPGVGAIKNELTFPR